jgi:RNA polymerase sigma factor (TIGR02999 family)
MADDSAETRITEWLCLWSGADRAALDQLFPLVHEGLRRMARSRLHSMAPGSSMQVTELANEAYRRLVDTARVNFRDRAPFFAVCATMMRKIVIDQARARARQQCGGDASRISLEHSVSSRE